MELVVKSLLYLNLLITNIQLLTTTNADRIHYYGDGICLVQESTIGHTFERAESCKNLSLSLVNFTEPSQELFNNITNRLVSLVIYRSYVNSFILPTDLIAFRLAETPGLTTKVIIDENCDYKLEEISLESLSQLPAHIDALSSLRIFECRSIHGINIDFTIFSKMMQLEQINLCDTAGVTIPRSLKLPSLRQLTIQNSLLTTFNLSSYELPKLEILSLRNNSLLVLPEHLNTFTNLVNFDIRRNKLRQVVLDVFANMGQLEILGLSDNNISELATKNIVDLPRLKQLDLDGNNLVELNVTLWSMPVLEYLCLSFNQLKQVQDLLELLTSKINVLLMYSNPWDCAWLNITVLQIPGMQVHTVDDNGSCYAFGRSTNQFGGSTWRKNK